MAIRLASITINSGATAVTVNAPAIDLTTLVQNGYELMVDGLSLPLTIVSGGNNSLEIAPEDAPTSNLTARAAKIIRTKGALPEAITKLESATDALVSVKNSVSVAADADSIAKRDSSGRVSVAVPENNNHAVNKGFLGTAATANKQTSNYDATQGSLLINGAHGLGAEAGLSVNDANVLQRIGFYQGGGGTAINFPVGTLGSNSAYYPYLTMRRPSGEETGSTLHIGKAGENVAAFIRATTDTGSTWADAELYHSGNTNFNEFGGVAANDVVAVGNAQQVGQATFYLPINSISSPTGIIVTSTFNIVRPDFSVVATGVTPSPAGGATSNRLLSVTVTGLSGLTIGEPLMLRQDDSTSKVEATF